MYNNNLFGIDGFYYPFYCSFIGMARSMYIYDVVE